MSSWLARRGPGNQCTFRRRLKLQSCSSSEECWQSVWFLAVLRLWLQKDAPESITPIFINFSASSLGLAAQGSSASPEAADQAQTHVNQLQAWLLSLSLHLEHECTPGSLGLEVREAATRRLWCAPRSLQSSKLSCCEAAPSNSLASHAALPCRQVRRPERRTSFSLMTSTCRRRPEFNASLQGVLGVALYIALLLPWPHVPGVLWSTATNRTDSAMDGLQRLVQPQGHGTNIARDQGSRAAACRDVPCM